MRHSSANKKGSTEVALCKIPILTPHFLTAQEAKLVGIIPYKPLSVQTGAVFLLLAFLLDALAAGEDELPVIEFE
jgi:hypothetical protein